MCFGKFSTAVLALSTALTLPLAASAATFTENFDDGLAQGWSLSGLWKITENSPNGTKALGYVQNETPGTILDGDFDTGVTNSGTAITPDFQCGVVCNLSFDWLNVGEGSSYDVFSVFADTATDALTVLASGVSGVYQNEAVNLFDLGLSQGDLFSVRFSFNTGDAISNDFAGARVDNFVVTTGTTAVPLPAGIPLLIGALGILGVMRKTRKHSV